MEKKVKKENAKLLNFTEDFLLNKSSDEVSIKEYPDIWQQNNLTLPLTYHFSPGDIDDGVSVVIPVALLNQCQAEGFDWFNSSIAFMI